MNQFWTLQGLGQPSDGVAPAWPALLGSSDWFEWNSLKLDWADDPADKAAQRDLLRRAKITGVTAAGAQSPGYVWPANNSENWLCPHPHFDQMPRFLCAVANDYAWSRDRTFLQAMKPRLEAVMDSLDGTMRAHDGLPACPSPYTGLPETGPNTTYMDCYREGAAVTWVAEEYYTALWDMVALETALGDHARAARYASRARRYPRQFDAALWNPRTRRYAGWRDVHGVLHDYGFTYLNLEALARGLGGPAQAAAIFDWLDHGTAQPAVMGGHVGSTDIYQCVVAPRSNTRAIPPADWDPWSVPESLRRSAMGYGALVEDGGAMLWVDFYDVLARLRWLDADSAWQRYAALLFRVAGDPLRLTGSVRQPTNAYGENYLEVGPADGPEGGLPGACPVLGFLGVHPGPDGLFASPNLPTVLLSLTSRGVCFGSAVCTVRAARGWIVAEGVRSSQAFTARQPFNTLGARVAAPARLRLERREGNAWKPVAEAAAFAQLPGVYAYLPVPPQPSGTYRIMVTNGAAIACRAAFVPMTTSAVGALHGPPLTFTTRRAFSRLQIRARGPLTGAITLERHLGDRWRPVAAAWTAGPGGGVLGFADQPAGAYRLRLPRAAAGTYALLSGRYTVTVTDGAVRTSLMVPAGGTVRLPVVAGPPVGRRITLASAANGRPIAASGDALIAEPGKPEVFDVQDAGGGLLSFRSASCREYVTVASDGALRLGPTPARFRWRHSLSGTFALFCPARGRCVSADLNHGGPLVARFATTVGSWEQFSWADAL